MRYGIHRIEKVTDGKSSFEQVNVTVSNLEAFRQSIEADEVHFMYEMID